MSTHFLINLNKILNVYFGIYIFQVIIRNVQILFILLYLPFYLYYVYN